jgi:hypothetical protein
MDAASQYAARLLAALLDATDSLRALAEDLRSRPGVVRVVQDLDMGHMGFSVGEPSASFIERYIDTELSNGHGVSCFVQLSWDTAQWTLEYSVRANRSPEQEYLIEFPDVHTESLDELIAALNHAVTELTAAMKALPLDTL